ncbi:hypothetical protein [Pseudofrankia asymbiotica]|uniref:Uncharacterized protein n=1 Tax=Pseudofrankia asymbiotica TaxID=1834516 RepID=A0A1V2I182_9ACTN|nr:hypothetical protein [Pseudofrankia asymbiotica]ONH23366.1 hypothetical protein BL253_33180 [Pseudofrankia asymbiotica]
MSNLPPHERGGWPRRWQPARIVPLPDGDVALRLHAGAPARELATLAGMLPSAFYVTHRPVTPAGAAVDLVFRDSAVGVAGSSPWRAPVGPAPEAVADALTVPGDPSGWVPDVGAVPDRGITPYQCALWELLAAAPDSASGARMAGLVQRLPPETVMVLADLLRERRARH